ncbi:hypothetical protein L1F30_05225 [Simiduia sp. 21SJ11W-1]|uniref:hypothetical protein n=1 Tax=Simiduia sp. 21SJ11W-1 TaxID=2909669 RepID=UPI0020A135A8|nr:hypothetical protein [Simiduia sp. 21SJ11W-1]UTA48948.1 hypothetical protein L1F30_05225 [Simiduia sp. 21SJ11W-1]
MNTEDLSELLPWYVNGSLTEAEKQRVDAWLAQSEQARAELAALRAIQQQIKHQGQAQASDLGWARLKRELNTPKAQPQWWRPAMASAAALVLCVQFIILARPAPAPDFTLLAAGQAGALSNGWLIQLELDANLRWEDLAATLTQHHARIVDGPSSIGILRIFIAKAQPGYTDRSQVESALGEMPGVVHAAIEAELP